MYIPLSLYGGKKCTTTILWVQYSRQVGELPPRKSNSLWGYGFFKKGFKSNRFQVVVWSQNLSFFLFRISSQILRFSPKLRYLSIFLFRISSQIWRFSQKLRFSFLKGFQAKKGLVLHVLCPSHPCASLARTVLKPLSFLAGTL